MLTLVVTVLLGLGFAYFATQNTGTVGLSFGKYNLTNVPIYLVVLIPLLIGLVTSFFIYMARGLSSSLTINEQKDEIEKLKEENAEIAKDMHKLELENTKLKTGSGEEFDEESI